MNLTAQINDMLEYLDDTEKILLLEIIKRFIPDDIITPDEREMIEVANRELANGETVSYNDIEW